jgi:uncharacterized membrane protein required for colicin V production
MNPQTLSIVLSIAVILFVLNGFLQGLIHMLGSIVGLVIGVGAASRWDAALGAWIASSTGWDKNVCTIIGFILILLVFTRVFGLALHILEKMFKFMKIPLVGLANKLAGGLLGFFEGIFVVGATLIIINSLPFPNFISTIAGSSVAAALIASAKLLLPLLPKSIRSLYET